MVSGTALRLSVPKYLNWETGNDLKHEFIDGNIYEMSGGTLNHGAIAAKIRALLIRDLSGADCIVFSSDVRVKVSDIRYVYPDGSVVCGSPVTEDNNTTLLNPILIVEVTSPTSTEYDRIEKRDMYHDVVSVMTYLIIDQHRPYVELYSRAQSGWHVQVFSDVDDVISIDIPKCELSLMDIYQGIQFEASQPD